MLPLGQEHVSRGRPRVVDDVDAMIHLNKLQASGVSDLVVSRTVSFRAALKIST